MPETLTIHTDGALRGNPGAAAFAYVIARAGEPPIEEGGCLGEMTNNQAEYTALVRALEHALRLGAGQPPARPRRQRTDGQADARRVQGQERRVARPLREGPRPRRQVHRRRRLHPRPPRTQQAAPTPCATRRSTANAAPGPRRAEDAAAPALHQQAIECLREAAAYPTPEEVWEKLVKVLKQHRIELPPAE